MVVIVVNVMTNCSFYYILIYVIRLYNIYSILNTTAWEHWRLRLQNMLSDAFNVQRSIAKQSDEQNVDIL